MAVRHLLLMTEEPATASAVAAALASNGRLANEDIYRDLTTLLPRLEAGGVPAVLVDIDARPAAILQDLEPIVRRFGETRFIVLSNTMQPELMLEAMQIGARHFMVKQSIPATLTGTLRRLCGGGNGHQREGTLITVLSAGGGCGATTIAVNLAHELGVASSAPVLLADMDHSYASISAYLGLDGEHGMVDLMEREGTIDAELIQTTALSASEHLKVLISTASTRLGDAVPAGYRRLAEILDACGQAYRNCVIDAPRVPLDVAAELAKTSALTLVVFQLSVKDIRMARAILSFLTARGVAGESILAAVSRYRRRGLPIALEEAKRVLPEFRLECLSNDFTAVSQSANFGQPLAQAAPRSPLRKELQQWASRILDGSLGRSRLLVHK